MGLTLTEIREVTSETDPTQDTGTDRKSEAGDGPRGVGEPRATGREISARVRTQVQKAFRNQNFGPGFSPDLGFHKRFVYSLMSEGFAADKAESITNEFYGRVERWLEDAVHVGQEYYSGPSDFMAVFDRLIDSEIETLCR